MYFYNLLFHNVTKHKIALCRRFSFHALKHVAYYNKYLKKKRSNDMIWRCKNLSLRSHKVLTHFWGPRDKEKK